MKIIKPRKFKLLALLFTLLFIGVFTASIGVVSVAVKSLKTYKIVIDAGHGGIDGGCVGSSKESVESELNLLIAKELESTLLSCGFSVFLTRDGNYGLYGTEEPGFKLRDLKKRVEITKEISPNIFISIHLNKYISESRRGAQVFYKINDKISKNLATKIQNRLNLLPESKRMYDALIGDYFILNENSCPSVIVECGFLSNPEEEKLLLTKNYRQKLAKSICDGIVDYLS